jgi:hypothetical protein
MNLHRVPGLALLLAGLAVSQAGAASQPILAGPWARSQQGYGHARPATIFNGGDPTGLLTHIEWLTWGGARAVGVGTSTYVGPHQATAEGTLQAAVVVLFKLGACRGHRAYDAVTWYFPEHGESFSATRYINACSGQYHE